MKSFYGLATGEIDWNLGLVYIVITLTSTFIRVHGAAIYVHIWIMCDFLTTLFIGIIRAEGFGMHIHTARLLNYKL